MKKVIISLIALISAVSLSSCQNEPAPVSPPAPVPDPVQILDLTASEVREKIGDITITPWVFLNDKPVIIDFHADWCGWCKKLEPNLWEIAHEYNGRIEIFRVDADDYPTLISQWKIHGLPALYFIAKNGAPKLYSGYRTTKQLRALVESELMN